MTIESGLPARWRDLVNAFTVGAIRERSAAATSTTVDNALAALADRPTADACLAEAALLSVYRRAGRLVETDQRPLPAPPDPDALPLCSAQAARLLQTLLENVGHRDLIAEWLSLAAKAGVKAPPELAPRLLELGTKEARYRPALIERIGNHGAWLARQSPAWAWAIAQPSAEINWDELDTADRVAALSRLRASDPAAARSIVQSIWASEPARRRIELLKIFDIHLDVEDEPWLESALDDKSQGVRTEIVALVGRIPGSRFSQRAGARAERFIKVKKTRLPLFFDLVNGVQLHIEAPSSYEPEWSRDAIELQPPAGMGERAGWLWQIATAAPLANWTAGDGIRPKELVAAALKADDGRVVLQAWLQATLRERDPAWAEAIWLYSETTEFCPDSSSLAGLLDVMSPETRDRLMLEVLRTFHSSEFKPALTAYWLNNCRTPWGSALTRRVCGVLCQGGWYPSLLGDVSAWGNYMDPMVALNTLHGDLDERSEVPVAANDGNLRRLWDRLEYRRELREALREV